MAAACGALEGTMADFVDSYPQCLKAAINCAALRETIYDGSSRKCRLSRLCRFCHSKNAEPEVWRTSGVVYAKMKPEQRLSNPA